MPTDDQGNWEPDEPHYYVIREGKPVQIEGYDGPIKCSGSFHAFRFAWPGADGHIETVWWHVQVWQPSTAVVGFLNRQGWKSHEAHAYGGSDDAVCWLTVDVDVARRILPDDEWDHHTPIFRAGSPF